jgi:hypothetical protein
LVCKDAKYYASLCYKACPCNIVEKIIPTELLGIKISRYFCCSSYILITKGGGNWPHETLATMPLAGKGATSILQQCGEISQMPG